MEKVNYYRFDHTMKEPEKLLEMPKLQPTEGMFNRDALDDEQALRCVAFIMNHICEDGNKELSGFLALTLSEVIFKCCDGIEWYRKAAAQDKVDAAKRVAEKS